MGANTEIQWATHTFNPWVGCQRVSPGCTNCYAEAYDKRVGGLPKNQRKDPKVQELRWGPKAPRVRTSAANWSKPLAWNEAAKKAGVRHRVFCASLADVFEEREDLRVMRLDLFDLISKTPHLDWLLLTKRPGNVMAHLRAARATFITSTPLDTWLASWLNHGQPPANVWLGTTVEDQQRADERIPELLAVPAAVRFLSCEPLLEPVNLRPWLGRAGTDPGVRWAIIGGESGPNARPFHLEWARDLVRQCRAAGVAPFVKQLGDNVVASLSDPTVRGMLLCAPAGGDPNEWPRDLRVREFPR